MRSPVGADLLAGLRSVGLGSVFGGALPSRPGLALDGERPTARGPASITRHDWRRAKIDLPTYAASGLPARTMGRGLTEDPLFFGAALAGGGVLAELAELAEAQASSVAPASSSGVRVQRQGAGASETDAKLRV